MPWTVDDVEKHNKGLTDHQKKVWVNVANSCLQKGDDDGTAIRKANGVVGKMHIEALLYQKAMALVEQAYLQEAAKILNEADPKPRVEKDGKGNPVVPSAEMYRHYFMAMSASHIKDQLNSAHERWKAASEKTNDKFAQAEVKAIGTEMSVANAVLRTKQSAETQHQKKSNKAFQKHKSKVTGAASELAGAFTHQSPMVRAIAHHMANYWVDKTHPKTS